MMGKVVFFDGKIIIRELVGRFVVKKKEFGIFGGVIIGIVSDNI